MAVSIAPRSRLPRWAKPPIHIEGQPEEPLPAAAGPLRGVEPLPVPVVAKAEVEVEAPGP